MLAAELLRLWLEDREGDVSPAKLECYEHYASDFATAHGSLEIENVTPGVVRSWVKAHPSWRSTSTQRDAFKAILQAFNFAVEERWLDSSPLVKLGKTLRNLPEARREFVISPEHERRFLAEAGANLSALFQGLLGTGRRPCELSHAKKSEVFDTPRGLQMRIAHHKNRRRSGPENIYLSHPMQRLVRWLLDDPFNATPYLFVTESRIQWTDTNISRSFDRAVSRAGLPSDFVAYSCRHTFCTRKLLAGVPLGVVAEMVGTSIQTLTRHYAHLEGASQDVFLAAANAG